MVINLDTASHMSESSAADKNFYIMIPVDGIQTLCNLADFTFSFQWLGLPLADGPNWTEPFLLAIEIISISQVVRLKRYETIAAMSKIIIIIITLFKWHKSLELDCRSDAKSVSVNFTAYLWRDAEHLQRWRHVQSRRNANVTEVYSKCLAPDSKMADVKHCELSGQCEDDGLTVVPT